jgi:hypothetical protein
VDALHRRNLGRVRQVVDDAVEQALHTDVLGGAGMNWRTVLVLDHGLLKGFPAGSLDRLSDIRPDFIADTT